jgi:pantoate kinase
MIPSTHPDKQSKMIKRQHNYHEEWVCYQQVDQVRAKAFCPGHITGFFEICDQFRDPLKRGSRGAGLSINRGVTTEVLMEESTHLTTEVLINGKIDDAPVTRSIVGWMVGSKKGVALRRIQVKHETQVPVGCGLGSSGAGAWGTALALNQLLESKLTFDKVGQVAHRAEVKSRTGLGTVLGQQRGGIEIRTKSGAPGIGHVDQIPFSPDLRVICSSLGPISTKSMLSDPKVRSKINRFGAGLVQKIINEASPKELMRLSRIFSEKTQLLSQNLKKGLELLDEKGHNDSSMALFGETLFTLVWADEVEDTLRIFREWNRLGETFAAEIDTMGARVLECEHDE